MTMNSLMVLSVSLTSRLPPWAGCQPLRPVCSTVVFSARMWLLVNTWRFTDVSQSYSILILNLCVWLIIILLDNRMFMRYFCFNLMYFVIWGIVFLCLPGRPQIYDNSSALAFKCWDYVCEPPHMAARTAWFIFSLLSYCVVSLPKKMECCTTQTGLAFTVHWKKV